MDAVDDDSANERTVCRALSLLVRATGTGALVLLIAMAGMGCGGGQDKERSSPDAGGDTRVESDTRTDSGSSSTVDEDKLLESGGVAVTEEIGITTTEGVLDKSIAVDSEPAPGATDETPLPKWAEPVGTPFRVSSSRTLDISAHEDPAYLMVPVPPDYDGDPTKLGIAKRTPRALFANDRVDPSTTHIWSVQPGYYIEEAGVFIAPLHFFYTKGLVYTLARSESTSSLTVRFPNREFEHVGTSETARQGLYRTKKQRGIINDAVNWGKNTAENIANGFKDVLSGLSKGVRKAVKKVVDTVEEAKKCLDDGGLKTKENFWIKCKGMDCNRSMRYAARDQLTKIYDQFVSDFRKPDLKRTLPCRKIDQDRDGTAEHYGRFYRYELRNYSEDGGMYLPPYNIAYTRTDPGKLPDEAVTRMEFFHAVQYNYASVNRRAEDWIIEGTAKFVENTKTTPDEAYRHRSEPLRYIDQPLTAWNDGNGNQPGYRNQDFWVYLINHLNSTPKKELKAVFSNLQFFYDSTPDLGKLGQLYDLSKLHWGWVRNQAFEARLTEGFGSDLGATCVPKDGNHNAKNKTWKSLEADLEYDPTKWNAPLRKTFRIEDGWKAEVAKVEVNNTSSKPFKVTLSAAGLSQPVKLYRGRSAGAQSCLNRGERPRRSSLEDTVPANSKHPYFLLMDHAQSFSEAEYFLKVDHLEANGDNQAPTARIVEPAPGELVSWENQKLKADAGDPGGANVGNGIGTYDWSVSHGGETIDDLDGDGNPAADGNPVTLSKLPYDENRYDGSITIELTVTDLDGDSVTVRETRSNLECRNTYETCSKDRECCSKSCDGTQCVGG